MKNRFLSGVCLPGGMPVPRRLCLRLAAVLTAVILTQAFLPAPVKTAGADTDSNVPVSFHVTGSLFRCGDFLYRVLEDGTAELTEYVSNEGIGDVPGTIGGYRVTEIGPGAFSEQGDRYSTDDDYRYTMRRDLLRIRLPEGIRKIGDGAFEGCDSLQEVELPLSLRTIGRRAFSGCQSLMRIVLPEGLEELGDYAFQDCPSLACLNLPASLRVIGANPFAGCSHLNRLDTAEGHPFLRFENGLLTDKSKNLLIACTAAAWAETAQVPDGIGVIGDSAFSGAPFTRILLPGSVETIGSLAFAGCERLTEMALPGSVRQIGDNPFRECTALLSLVLSPDQDIFSLRNQALIDEKESRLIAFLPLPETETVSCYGTAMKRIRKRDWENPGRVLEQPVEIKEYSVPEGIRVIAGSAFYGSTADTIHLPDSVLEIGPEAFAECRSLGYFYLPPKLTVIPDRLFYHSMMVNVLVPEGVTSIGAYAFSHTDLDSMDLPGTVECIGEYAFSFCRYMEDIRLSPRITSIPRGAFLQCSMLDHLTLPKGITDIGPEAFSYCAVQSIQLPEGITAIRDWCFYCSQVSEITLPESVAFIGSYAFAGNGYDSPSLETIHLNQTLRYIGDHAFWGARFLKDGIELPDSLVCLGSDAFRGCEALTKVRLGNGLQEISPRAFKDTALTEIVLPDVVTAVGTEAFSGCASLETAVLPEGAVRMAGNPFANCPALRDIRLSPHHPNLSLEGGFLTDRTERSLICTLPYSETVVIPDGIETIADAAFADRFSLREAVFPKSLRRIGHDAFRDCGLQTIALPDGLTWIGDRAFQEVYAGQITLPDSLVWIGDYAFCMEPVRWREKPEPFRTLTLPKRLQHIGAEAFSGLAMRQLILPDSLEWIGDRAFADSEIGQVVFHGHAVTLDGNPFPGMCPQIILPDDHPALELADGNLYDKAGRRLIAQFSDAPILEGTLEIGSGALDFSGGKIFLPASVRLIRSLNRWHDYGLWRSTLDGLEVYVVPGSAAEAYLETINDDFIPACYYDW